MTLATTILVLAIARRANDPTLVAFERAAVGILGERGSVEVRTVSDDPPDRESEESARTVDGVVELSWSDDRQSARLHFYVTAEKRWVDRAISFGGGPEDGPRDAEERGRLLGFAAASAFAESPAPNVKRADDEVPAPRPAVEPRKATSPPSVLPSRALEFAGAVSSGIRGTAGGIGATAALRWRLPPGLWARVAFLGRTGTIAVAQATTRSLQFGAGISVPLAESATAPWVVGARADGWACLFEASHLSEDDVAPDRRSRWVPGSDLLLEAGFRFTPSTGVFGAAGLELIFGKTEVYTHGNRVALVPPLRAVGELGFQAMF